MNYSWGHNRRFNAYAAYLKKQFGKRVQKVTIDAGFACPNRDGTISRGGCSFCNNDAFNPGYCNPAKPISRQINEGILFHQKRYKGVNQFLAYFQAYSNTYGALEEISKKYEEAILDPRIIGLVIGTRPDCIDEEKLDYFQHLSEKMHVMIEYGIESVYDETLKKINRGHDFETTARIIEKTANRGILTGGHVIFGLPGETEEMMLNEASILSELPLNNIKFHQLQIIKNTEIAKEYKTKPELFRSFTLDEYLDFFILFIEHFNPDIVIERIAGESPPVYIEGPRWGNVRNDEIIRRFEQKLQEKDSWQGKFYKQTTHAKE